MKKIHHPSVWLHPIDLKPFLWRLHTFMTLYILINVLINRIEAWWIFFRSCHRYLLLGSVIMISRLCIKSYNSMSFFNVNSIYYWQFQGIHIVWNDKFALYMKISSYITTAIKRVCINSTHKIICAFQTTFIGKSGISTLNKSLISIFIHCVRNTYIHYTSYLTYD